MEAFKENGIFTEVIRNIKKGEAPLEKEILFVALGAALKKHSAVELPFFHQLISFLLNKQTICWSFFWDFKHLPKDIFFILCVVESVLQHKEKIFKAKEILFIYYQLKQQSKQVSKQHRYTQTL